MASKDIVIGDQTYYGVPAIEVDQSGGGTARFVETSDGTAVAADIADGKTAYVGGQKVTGTNQGTTPVLQQKSVNPSESQQTVQPDSGYDGLSKVTVGAIQTEEKTVTQNGVVTPTSGKYLKKVTVNVAAPTPLLQTKSATPSESAQQIRADSAYDGLEQVNISAIQTEEKTAVQNGVVTPTSGKYLKKVTVAVPEPEINLQNKTVTQNGTVTADEGYDGLSSVTVNVSGGGGGLPDVILPGDTPILMSDIAGGATNASSLTTLGSSLTIPKSGTYRIKTAVTRSSNSGSVTWTIGIYKNGTLISSPIDWYEFTDRRHNRFSFDVALSAGDVLQVKASVSNTSYYIFTGPIIACIDWDVV